MDPVDYLKILRRRWTVIASACLLAAVAAWVLTPAESSGVSSDSYVARATLVQDPGSSRPVEYVALIASTGPVPEAVAERIGFDGEPALLAQQVQVQSDPDVGSVTIQAMGPDPGRTATTANAFAEETIAAIREGEQLQADQLVDRLSAQIDAVAEELGTWQQRLDLNPSDTVAAGQTQLLTEHFAALNTQRDQLLATAAGQLNLRVLDEATALPATEGGINAPSSRGGRLLLGLVVGLLLGGALALLLERFDTSLWDRIDVQRVYRVPVLAEIPKFSRSLTTSRALVMVERPSSASAEAYRSLRSSLLLMSSSVLEPGQSGGMWAGLPRDAEHRAPQVVLVTSARSGEGKTTTATNLAASLAEVGKRVLVLDCDFHRPDAHRYLDVPPGPGLSDLMHSGDSHELLALSRPTAVPGVRLVTAGTAADESLTLPTRIAEVMNDARDMADIVIVDSPPMLLGNDAMDLMPYVDTVLVVCRSGRTTEEQAERASELLARMRVPVVGAALVGWQAAPARQFLPPFTSSSTGSNRTLTMGRPPVGREPR